MSFVFEKRYADLVTPTGDVFVAYASRLRWGSVSHDFAGATHYRADGTSRAIRASVVPNDLDGPMRPALREIRFSCETGEFRLRYEPGPGPWRQAAAPPARGLQWWVERPRAMGTAVWPGDGEVHAGLGYVDRVRLRRSLGRIGLRRLDWGRAHLPDATVVYLYLQLRRGPDWSRVARWPGGAASPEEGPLPDLAPGAAPPGLAPVRHRLLHRGPAGQLVPDAGLGDRLLLRLFAGRLSDERWLSRAERADERSPAGWVVHETVRR